MSGNETVESLSVEISQITRDLEQWVKIKGDPTYDKKGLEICLPDGYFVSGKTAVQFSSHAGIYGSSSCSTVFSFRDNFMRHFLKLLNRDVEKLIRDVLASMETERSQRKQEAIDRLNGELEKTKAW